MVMQSIFDNFSQTPTADPDEEERQRQGALGPPQSPLGPPSPPAPDYTPQLQAANQVQGMLANLPGQLGAIDQYRAQNPDRGNLLERGIGAASDVLGRIPVNPFNVPTNVFNAATSQVGLPAIPTPTDIVNTGLGAAGLGNPIPQTLSDVMQGQNQAMGVYNQGLQQVPGYNSLPAPVQAGVQALPYALLPGGPEALLPRVATAFGSGVAGYGAQQGAAALGAGPNVQQAAGLLGGLAVYQGAGALGRAEPVPELQRTAPEAIATPEGRLLQRGQLTPEGAAAIPPGQPGPNYSFTDAAARERAAVPDTATQYREQIARAVPPELQPVYNAALDDVLAGRRAQAPSPEGSLGPDAGAEPYRIAHDTIRQQLAPDMAYLPPPEGRPAPITQEATLSGITPAQSEAGFDAMAARNQAITRPESPEGIAFRQTPEGQAWQAQRATGAVAGEAAAPINNVGGAVPGGRGGGTYQRGPGMSGPGNVRGTGGAAGGTTPPGAGAGGVPPGAGTPPGAGAPPPPGGAGAGGAGVPPSAGGGTGPTSNLPPLIQTFGTRWLEHNQARFDRPLSMLKFAQDQAGRIIGGHPAADSYLAAILERRPVLQDRINSTGLSKADKAAAVKDYIRQDMERHYGGDMAKVAQAEALLAAHDVRTREIRAETQPTQQLSDRTKNSMLSLDQGYWGANMLMGVHNQFFPLVAGEMNRIATALRIPGRLDLQKMTGLPRIEAAMNAGLHLSGPESIRTQGEGTLLSYAPGLATVDKRIITPILDKLTDVQYGNLGGYAKLTAYEGQLQMLRLAGANVKDPVVQAAVAKTVNDSFGSARTSTEPGRAALESHGLLSSAMTRAGINRVIDVGQLLNPSASYAERVIAAGIIASNAAAILGIGKLVNDQVGLTDWVSNPLEPGFGLVTTPFKDANGRNIVVNLYPGETFARNLLKSAEVLSTADDPAKLKDIWERYPFQRANPLIGDAARLTLGAGYNAEGKFYTSGMPRDEAIRSSLPIPLIAQQAMQAADPASLAFSFGGISEYPESAGAQKARLGGEILDNPQTLSTVFKGEEAPLSNLLRGKDWNELISTEKSTMAKNLPAEEVKSLHDEAMRQNPAVTRHTDLVQFIGEKKTAVENEILDRYNRKELDGPHAANLMKAAQRDYYSIKDKADADPAYKAEVAKFDKSHQNAGQVALDGFYQIEDKAARQEYLKRIAQGDPELGARLYIATQPRNQSKLETMYYAGELR